MFCELLRVHMIMVFLKLFTEIYLYSESLTDLIYTVLNTEKGHETDLLSETLICMTISDSDSDSDFICCIWDSDF